MEMVMPRAFSSGALSIWSKAVKELLEGSASARTLVMAAVSVVLPWSMWPIVPMLRWGLDRSNFCFAIEQPLAVVLVLGSGGRTRTDDPSIMSRVLLPTELRRPVGFEDDAVRHHG